ncbi:caspase family protein [Streptomyces siamensis]|uniref:Peptidase C14 caspase domain-containing protein n=1 Tax=Streptomyces siamensis TaxID=1274986 RepID=A0ABP9JK66_9ACTN
MSQRAVEPARSRIVLVGPSHYDDPRLPDVPVIANNISDLARVLTDEKLGGFSPFHCVPVPPAAGVAQVGDVLVRAAEEAEDLLLFYYSGHGLLSPRRRELYLSLAATRPDQLAFTALPFEAIRDACLESRATNRVVILDSCFSGRAIGDTLADEDETVLGELEVSGAYTLTSAPGNRTALILPGERHTAFTERLLALLNAGSPAAGAMISLRDIYRHLHTQLRAEGLPVPQRCGVNNADLLGLVRNVHSAPLSHDTPAVAGTAEPEGLSGTDMAERLVHAKGIANTISDGMWRARSLTRVALVAAAGNDGSERTGRLIDQAEQAASTADENPGKALTAVATAVAPFDPDRAERIARRADGTTNEGYALTALAKVVAASDPDRAERIANTITEKHYRWPALSAVAAAVAASDPDRAEHLATIIADKHYRWPALSAVAAAVAASDPDRAERIANTITDKHYRWPALSAVAAAVAATDPDRAERIANTITDKHYRWPALSAVAAALSASDLDRAERIATDMIRTYTRWPTVLSMEIVAAANLAGSLSTVVAALAAKDPHRAERIAHATPHKPSREGVLAAAAKAVAATDPDRAERIANTITDKHYRWPALSAAAAAVAATDPDRAERIANTITDKHVQVTALTAVASAVAAEDPERAGNLIDQAEQTATRARIPRALIAVVTAAYTFAPDRAERIAYAISDKSVKESVLVALGKAVAATDPDRAERIANALTDRYAVVRVRAAVARSVAVADPDRARLITQQIQSPDKAEILHSIVLVLTDNTR